MNKDGLKELIKEVMIEIEEGSTPEQSEVMDALFHNLSNQKQARLNYMAWSAFVDKSSEFAEREIEIIRQGIMKIFARNPNYFVVGLGIKDALQKAANTSAVVHEGRKNLSRMKVIAGKRKNTKIGVRGRPATSTSVSKEGKKSKKPATSKLVKEDIQTIIKEVVDEYRTKGALGAKNLARTTPLKATGTNYKAKKAANDDGSSFTFEFIDPSEKVKTLDSNLHWYDPSQLVSYLEKEVMAFTGDLHSKLSPKVSEFLKSLRQAEEASWAGDESGLQAINASGIKRFVFKYNPETAEVVMKGKKS